MQYDLDMKTYIKHKPINKSSPLFSMEKNTDNMNSMCKFCFKKQHVI